MECRHSLSLSSVIGPPHSHFVNRAVVTDKLTYAAAAIASANDAQVALTFAKVIRMSVFFSLINTLFLKISQISILYNLINTFTLFYAKSLC